MRSTADGAVIGQWSDTGAPNQQWQVVAVGGGYYKLVARHSGKVLDVNAATTADGAAVVQWADTAAPNQQWQLVRFA